MKALVVYDTAFGNTEKIARAIAEGLGGPPDVEVLRVSEVQPAHLAGVTLLVAGSPTQKLRPLPSVTAWLKAIPGGRLKGVRVAAFDTRMTQAAIKEIRVLPVFVKLFGYAAKPIADELRKKGGELVAPPAGFFITGTEVHLLDGELERAAEWGRQLAAAAAA